MSNIEDNKQQTQSVEGKKGETVKIMLDPSPQVEELRKQLDDVRKKADDQAREAERKFREAEQARLDAIKKAEDEKKSVEEQRKLLEQEKDDYKNKLDLIAEKEFIAKKTALLERAKKDNIPEGKYKEIEAKLSDPEKGPQNVAATEFILQMVEDAIVNQNKAIEKAQEEARKADEARRQAELANEGKRAPTTGETAPLEGLNQTKPKTNGNSYIPDFSAKRTKEEQLIVDLYAIKNSPTSTPQQKAQADSQIRQLITRAAVDYRDKYRHQKPLASELIQKDEKGVEGYSPYSKREEIKTFKEMKKSGV